MTDLLVVAGGDGSILRVIGQLGEMIKPIFGINVGSLGFLTCVSSSNYREAVECIAKDRINFSHRALLEAEGYPGRQKNEQNARAKRRCPEPRRTFAPCHSANRSRVELRERFAVDSSA